MKRELNRVLILIMHQVLATLVVFLLAGVLTEVVLEVPTLWGHLFHLSDMRRILNGTPYFPVYIVVALLWGWLLGRQFRHRVMLWVWVFPLIALGWAMLEAPPTFTLDSVPGVDIPAYTRLSHFFGWQCRVENRCFDTILLTLPFYAAASYSIGAWLALNVGIRSRLVDRIQFWSIVTTGLAVLVDSVFEIKYSAQIMASEPRWLSVSTGTFTAVLFVGFELGMVRLALGIWRRGNNPAPPFVEPEAAQPQP